jgi:hypothetical protein
MELFTKGATSVSGFCEVIPPILVNINSLKIHSMDNSPPGSGTKRLAVVVTLATLNISNQFKVYSGLFNPAK